MILPARWQNWLRHYAKSRKVAGSIPDEVIVIFSVYLFFSRTVVLGFTQPLAEMSNRNIPVR
jgi:hypothetical protein